MSVQRIQHYIGGSMVDPAGGLWMDDIEPAAGAAYAQLPDGDAADVDRAAEAAVGAFEAWSHTPASERSAVMLRIADLMDRDFEALVRTESIVERSFEAEAG